MNDYVVACAKQEEFERILSSEAQSELVLAISVLAESTHRLNEKWWVDLETGAPLVRNDGEMIALMHSELSEALEGVRKNLMDSHLPHRKSVEVEMADTVIRIMDFCAGRGLDLGGAIMEKLVYNWHRQDHTLEARREADGKKF